MKNEDEITEKQTAVGRWNFALWNDLIPEPQNL